MKKIIILLSLFVLTSCFKKDTIIQVDIKDKYISPINEISYISILNDDLKDRMMKIYGNEEAKNNLFEMIDSKLCTIDTVDYYGNTISFNDYKDSDLIVEIVQYSCEHCLKQVKLTEEILKHDDSFDFIQYFAVGDKEQVKEFYEKADTPVPTKPIVIPKDHQVGEFFSSIGVDSTPTFLFYHNGVLKYAYAAELSYAVFSNASEFAFNNPISRSDLVDNDGNDIFSQSRDYDDVLADFSNENRDKLALLGDAEDLTVNVVGKYVEFYTLVEKEGEPLYSLDSYIKFVNKPLTVFYVADYNNNLEHDVEMINKYIEDSKDLNVLVIFIDNDDFSTSQNYYDSGLKLNCDVVSKSAELIQALFEAPVNEYPAVLFIQDNTFMGGINAIKDNEELNYARDIFLGEDSISRSTK